MRRRFLFLATAAAVRAATPAVPPTPEPALRFSDTSTILSTADGGLRPLVGTHNIQVVRGSRSPATTTHAHGLAHTYLHAPMLAWWRGQFYLDYLSAPINEHDTDTSTSYTTSPDGLTWSAPRQLFPAIRLPDGSLSVMHQRASFYVAPGDRLLATGFHGKAPSPNDGSGVGRVVREIHADGTLGPIYFIRVNRHAGWTDAQLPHPLYTTAPDAGFVAACTALLADRATTAQWWEEERSPDGFFDLTLKAISTLRRPDGALVAIAKDAQHALSTDDGRTWQRLGFVPGLPVNSSKYWLQPTSDGRFALALNPTDRLRFPLAVATSTDAVHFGDLATIHAELPPQRHPGKFKNLGPQYVRGISAGNGTPPDGALWLTYSVNKEDIWIARAPVPLATTVPETRIHDDFTVTPAGTLPATWNIYSPAWAPVRVVDTGSPAGHALELRDTDPHDYARAVRVFPATHGLAASFRVLPRQTSARLEIEFLGPRGERATALAFGEDGRLWINHEGVWTDNGPYSAGAWISFRFTLPPHPDADRGDWLIDARPARPPSAGPVESTATLERLSFRTGPQRVRSYGAGYDLPDADTPTAPGVFLVDDVTLEPLR